MRTTQQLAMSPPYRADLGNRSGRGSQLFTWEQAVRILKKNRIFLLLFAGTLTATIACFAILLPNRYQPIARVEIDPLNSGIKTLHEIEDSRATDNQDYLETQVQILQSEALAVRVIRALHLDRNPEFVPAKDQSSSSQSGETVQLVPASHTDESTIFKDQFAIANRTPQESTALSFFQQHLAVVPVRNSRLVEISFSSKDPRLAQLITNSLVTQFIEQNFRNRYTSTMEASEWLSSQLNDLRQKVSESNQAVTEYQKKFNLVEADDRDVPTAQLMNDVNHQFSDAQASRMEAEAYVRMIDLGQAESVPAVRDDQLYQNMMARYVDVRAQLAQARSIYGDENSNVKKLQDAETELAKQIEAERARMINRVRTSFAAASAREQMMSQSREKLRAEMGDASSHLVTYRMLKNEAIANAELYNTLQGRLKEAGIYAGLRSSNIQVIDLASNLHKPTGPHRPLIIGVGMMFSCALALFFTFVRESFDNSVRTPDDIHEWAGLPVLAIVPDIDMKVVSASPVPLFMSSNLSQKNNDAMQPILFRDLQTPEAEAMRSLRAALFLSKTQEIPRIVLITSSSAAEGKTTVAANLAVVLALQGKTCLVEADLRRPTTASVFGVKGKAGITSVLNKTTALDTAMVALPDVPGLTVLPAGPESISPADQLASAEMNVLISVLRNQFDYVVIDCAPVIPFSDARILSAHADAVIVVTRYGKTTRRALSRCVELLGEVQAPVVGAVLSGIGLNSADYHYYNFGYSKDMSAALKYYRANDNKPPTPPSTPTRENRKGAHA